ncbi:E3 ubiquitin-protein ligase rnf126 [Clonorchis sinensis]|uniref:RING-type E3 ubiquitin transferase n=1 Tax=Clonorchis sinensis TaxID=79923 RepID=A0A8T1MIP6_CLOSI|nr:E3 ubiquitin-protein ligase rnf126 [Clonorchis sinensis]
MASPVSRQGYYCHSCQAEVDANLQDFTCSNCHSGFIEELESRSENNTSLPENTFDPFQLWQSIVGGFSPRTSAGISSEPEDEDELMEEAFEQSRPRRSSRRSGGGRQSWGPERLTFRLQGQPGLGSTRVRLTTLDNPLLIHFLSGLDSIQGDIRDYALNQGMFENLLALLTNQLHVGPPPASEATIQQLPVQKLTEDSVAQYKTCSICFEDYQVSEEVMQLPCQHVYHTTCVTTWLKQHATCPVCRKDLNGRDTSMDGTGPNRDGTEQTPSSSNS